MLPACWRRWPSGWHRRRRRSDNRGRFAGLPVRRWSVRNSHAAVGRAVAANEARRAGCRDVWPRRRCRIRYPVPLPRTVLSASPCGCRRPDVDRAWPGGNRSSRRRDAGPAAGPGSERRSRSVPENRESPRGLGRTRRRSNTVRLGLPVRAPPSSCSAAFVLRRDGRRYRKWRGDKVRSGGAARCPASGPPIRSACRKPRRFQRIGEARHRDC